MGYGAPLLIMEHATQEVNVFAGWYKLMDLHYRRM
jgi:hypothetical protein